MKEPPLIEILLTDRTTDAVFNVDVRHTLPRYLKQTAVQKSRTKKSAEVFTPSWVCNAQNNLVDDAWFGKPNNFNFENNDKTWKTNPDKVTYPIGMGFYDYVASNRLEITCGEAPYLVSRYDTVSGVRIPVPDRIGFLDRKLRVITENIDDEDVWIYHAIMAVKSIYGYEYQLDSLWLARKNIVQSVKEHFRYTFHHPMPVMAVSRIAYIVSWNIFHMDGLRCTIPNTCSDKCRGCKKQGIEGIHMHNGIYAKTMDWDTEQPIEFIECINDDDKKENDAPVTPALF